MEMRRTYSKLNGLDLALELTGLVSSDRGGDNRAGNATGPAEGGLGGNKNVRHVLVLAEQGQVEHDLNGFDVGSHDDKLADTAVERLGGLVGALLQLLVVRSLLDEVEDLVGERSISQGEGLGVGSRHGCGCSGRDGIEVVLMMRRRDLTPGVKQGSRVKAQRRKRRKRKRDGGTKRNGKVETLEVVPLWPAVQLVSTCSYP